MSDDTPPVDGTPCETARRRRRLAALTAACLAAACLAASSAASTVRADTDTSASPVVEGGSVVLELVPDDPDDRGLTELVARVRGATVLGRAPGLVLVEAPADRGAALADTLATFGAIARDPVVIDARPESPTARPEQYGPTTGGAETTTGAVDWHTAGLTGQGVKIGVIDYFDIPAYWNVAEHGPLPVAGVNALCRRVGTDCTAEFFDGSDLGGEDHGVAVIESIRDMAPDAEIYLGQASTTADYQAIVDWFVANGVSIISRSLGSRYDGPGDGRGLLDAVADDAVSKGLLWVNSGGNNAVGQYYRQPVRLSGGNVAFGPSGSDIFLDFTACVRLAGVRWTNDWDLPAANRTDYDVYLWESPDGAPASGSIIDSSTLDQASGASPLEQLGNDHCPAPGNRLYLEVRHFSGDTTGDEIELLDFGSGIDEYTQSAGSAAVSIVDSANPGVLAVGAMSASPSDQIAWFSSRGPTTDGRIAPDLAAPGVYFSSVYGGNFLGTSAAAPVVSGGAALVLEAGLSTSGAELGALLRTMVVDRGDDGPDSTYGHGEFRLPAPPVPATYGPSSYVPLDIPERVLDTRTNHAIGPPELIARLDPREIIDFPIAAQAGLPADATAVALNVVSVAPDAAGHLQLFPTGEPVVDDYSNLNTDQGGQIRANFAVIPLGTGGSISVMAHAGGDVVIDLLGWFEEAPGTVGAGRFVALSEAERVVDSRWIPPTQPLASGEVRDVPMPQGVDLRDVEALVVTVTSTLASDPGWVQIIPAGEPGAIAATSTLNLVPNETVANAAIVPVGPDGIALTSFFLNDGDAEVIVDVTGYITSASAPDSTAGRFVPLVPDRAYDSRDVGVKLVDRQLIAVDARPIGVSNTASGVMWNLTAAGTDRAGHAVGWAAGTAEPDTSVLNWSAPGMIRASGAIIAVDSGTASFAVEDGPVDSAAGLTHFITDVFGYFT